VPIGNRTDPNSSKKPIVAITVPATENKSTPPKEESITFQPQAPKYSFSDIILNSATYDAVQDLLVIVSKRELIFDTWGLGEAHKQQNKAGINLYGASGTGKTMVAHAIANQLGRKLLIVDYSQIESRYVGDTSKNLVAMFKQAKEDNAVIFFDEADALLSKRVTNMSSSTDVSVNQTRSTLLLLINDYDDIIIFATNFITNYDPAFMRRILGHVKFELPNEENRKKLWSLYIPVKMPIDSDRVTLINELAEKSDGVSGSDISNAVLQSALKAARQDEKFVKRDYFIEAVKRAKCSKSDNTDNDVEIISQRTVSEEYVNQELGRNKNNGN
jgi:SpoVK/Ycf46/Vps4 family AAA+-type ATPase